MRVLHVIPKIAPRYGGPSEAVRAMCRALQCAGAESCIATTDADGAGRLRVPYGRMSRYGDVDVAFFPRQWGEVVNLSLPLARWLDAHVEEFDVVEIHAVFAHASLAAARVCRRHRVPYVVRPLGSLATWSLAQKAWRKRLFWHLGGKRMLEAAAAVHYTSTEERRQAEQALQLPRGVVVPLPVESVEPGHAGSPWGNAPYVLVLSRLHAKKCLDVLIEAFAAATATEPLSSWRLVLAGEGEAGYVDNLRTIAQHFGVGDRVLFPGWISGEEKQAALAAAALFALPSRQENFGLGAVEALAAGVPVLLSPEVDLAEDLYRCGAAWVASPERDALADALRQALADESERRERGRAGREYVRDNFSPASVGARLLAFYRSLTDIGQPAVG